MNFELTFYDIGQWRTGRYRRHHRQLEAAKAEALRVLGRLPDRDAHPAIIYQGNTQVAVVR